MEEGTCMEENRSLPRLMEGWEKEPGRLRCRYICSFLCRQLDRKWRGTSLLRGRVGSVGVSRNQ